MQRRPLGAWFRTVCLAAALLALPIACAEAVAGQTLPAVVELSGYSVPAGSELGVRATLDLTNYGHPELGVVCEVAAATASIPDLQISGELHFDDVDHRGTVLLPLPADAAPGVYHVEVSAEGCSFMGPVSFTVLAPLVAGAPDAPPPAAQVDTTVTFTG